MQWNVFINSELKLGNKGVSYCWKTGCDTEHDFSMCCWSDAPDGLQHWIWEGTSDKYLAGDWMNHLSVTAYHGLTSTNQITSRTALPQVEPAGRKYSPSFGITDTFLCLTGEGTYDKDRRSRLWPGSDAVLTSIVHRSTEATKWKLKMITTTCIYCTNKHYMK